MITISPDTVIKYTKLTVVLVCSWPPSSHASQREKIIFNICWWISWIISISLVIPLIYAAYDERKNVLSFTKSLCLAVSCSQCAIKMFICKLQSHRMQFLLDEMEDYMCNAEHFEKLIFQQYIKKVGIVHVLINVASLLASIAVILGPIVLPQPLPTDAKYPFSMENHPVIDIIYILQAFAGLQCASIGSIDCQMAVLLWYVVARLELLGIEMKKITTTNQFNECVRKHQQILGYTNEIIRACRPLQSITVIMTMLSVVLGGVHIVGNQPIIVRMQFIIVVGGFSMLLFISAWPSDSLIRQCENISWSIYGCEWTKNQLNRSVIFVIQRTKKPAIIEVSGLVPTMSLIYYSQFLSKTLSFFTTLRIMLAKIE